MKLKMKIAVAATALAMGASAQAAQERVIVKFKDGKGPSVKAMAAKAGGELKVDLANLNAFAVEMPASALNGLRNNPHVEYVETDVKRFPLATNLNNTEVTPYGLSKVQADLVSDSLAANRKVCIIDSGYDISNSDLANNSVSGTSDSGTGNWYEAGGSHGTHVAGTIAGLTNGSGVVGVMPNGKIGLHIIKVFNASGWGYSSSLISAANECANQGSNVISMSLGGGSSSRTERNGFASLESQGVLNIAAAGNDGNTAHSYPASYDSVVSVAAVDSNNQHANFSQRTNQVEVSGPGVAVLSSVAGDGRLSQLEVGGTDYFANGVVPHIFYNSAGSYSPANTDGSASGTLAACTTSGNGSVSCPSMSGKICLVERPFNELDDTSTTQNKYPENKAADACADAGANGIIVYSNAAKPGLQAPFMVDWNGKIGSRPHVSVDRATGLELLGRVGQSVSMDKTPNHDWEYYDGTSMATPHVSAVAALAWSHHPACTATDVRNALKNTAVDLETAGRDDKTGYGLVQAKAAKDYLAALPCGGGNPPANQAPTAAFTFSCTDLACSFDGSDSSDSDGTISSYSWSFGGSGVNANHTFASEGSYSVTLTVTDNDGATATSTQTVTVSDGGTTEPPAADITLTGFRSKGNRQATINWTGANGTNVDVYVNGSFNNSTANDGSVTYNVNKRSSYTFQVCETGSTTACSNEITL